MNFVSYAQLARDIADWVQDLPRFDAVIGIERSGIIPATMLALHWNVPLFTLNQAVMGDCVPRGGGRLDKSKPIRKVLVVDDSSNGGAAMRRAKIALSATNPFPSISYAAVYVSDGNHVDHYCKVIPQPRAFQWNLLHHDVTPCACFDMDGVICEDVPTEENDDGEKYTRFIRDARPLNIPTVKAGAIVTGRLEKYRALTEEWLAIHKVSYGHLEMMPFDRPEDRRTYGIARRKAEIYRSADYHLFVENAEGQAKEIKAATGKPVLIAGGPIEWRMA